MATLLHLTTVHHRTDARILSKEANTLASHLPHKVLLMVADGEGNVDEEHGLVSIHDLGRLGGGRLGRALIGPWRAFFAIRRIKPATVHFHDPELIPLGMLLKVIGYKVIYDVHEDVPRQTFSKHWIPKIIRYPVMLAMSLIEWGAAKSFDAMIPATPKIAARFPAEKTVLVQNFPIGSELVVPDVTPYSQRDFCFAYVGGITTIRGAVEMILALEYLHDIPGVRLELAGEFSPSNLEASLRALPGWASVHYHGNISRALVARILGGVRAGLVLFHPLPNHIDAQPNKMFEYMSAGITVIASDFPLWRQIIEGAGCGLLVDPLNPKAIAEAMRWILDHPVEAEAMGQRGRQAVERTYNWETEATKLLNFYKQILST
jgi:glycosyltransferase involved in cell wall biosynthesis